MAKFKLHGWHDLPRQTRLARVLYPQLADAEGRQEIAKLARRERKKAPAQETLLSDEDRGYVSPLGGQSRK